MRNILYNIKKSDFLKWRYLYSDSFVQDLSVNLKWHNFQSLKKKALNFFMELKFCKSHEQAQKMYRWPLMTCIPLICLWVYNHGTDIPKDKNNSVFKRHFS